MVKENANYTTHCKTEKETNTRLKDLERRRIAYQEFRLRSLERLVFCFTATFERAQRCSKLLAPAITTKRPALICATARISQRFFETSSRAKLRPSSS